MQNLPTGQSCLLLNKENNKGIAKNKLTKMSFATNIGLIKTNFQYIFGKSVSVVSMSTLKW